LLYSAKAFGDIVLKGRSYISIWKWQCFANMYSGLGVLRIGNCPVLGDITTTAVFVSLLDRLQSMISIK